MNRSQFTNLLQCLLQFNTCKAALTRCQEMPIQKYRRKISPKIHHQKDRTKIPHPKGPHKKRP